MHDGHGRNGLCDDAAGGDYGAAPNGYVGKNDCAGPDESILLDLYALGFAEMSDDRDAHAKGRAFFNGDEIRARGIQDDVVADPNIFPDVYAAEAMQSHAQAARARRNPSQVLKDSVANALPQVLFALYHFCPGFSHHWSGDEALRFPILFLFKT